MLSGPSDFLPSPPAMSAPLRLLASLLLPALAAACSPPLQHFTGLPPAPLEAGKKNVLLIGDSISMGGDRPGRRGMPFAPTPRARLPTLAGTAHGHGERVLPAD